MIEHNSSAEDHSLRIPPIVWVLGVSLAVALVAIFFFNVAVSTVVNYLFIALMIGSHFFMHGGHGGHGSSAGHQRVSTSNNTDSDKNEHSGGCH